VGSGVIDIPQPRNIDPQAIDMRRTVVDDSLFTSIEDTIVERILPASNHDLALQNAYPLTGAWQFFRVFENSPQPNTEGAPSFLRLEEGLRRG
jgi:hypothetical protein